MGITDTCYNLLNDVAVDNSRSVISQILLYSAQFLVYSVIISSAMLNVGLLCHNQLCSDKADKALLMKRCVLV